MALGSSGVATRRSQGVKEARDQAFKSLDVKGNQRFLLVAFGKAFAGWFAALPSVDTI
jgi:hypothetical protein